MDELIRLHGNAAEYPKNLVSTHTYQHVLHSYAQRLNEKERSLFCSQDKAVVDFLQFDEGGSGVCLGKRWNQMAQLFFRVLGQVCTQCRGASPAASHRFCPPTP
jgi:hypothetical protein